MLDEWVRRQTVGLDEESYFEGCWIDEYGVKLMGEGKRRGSER